MGDRHASPQKLARSGAGIPAAAHAVEGWDMRTFAAEPAKYDFWDFGTNAVTPVSMGIPTIGFGPGEYKLAHMRDERCAVESIQKAAEFYSAMIKEL